MISLKAPGFQGFQATANIGKESADYTAELNSARSKGTRHARVAIVRQQFVIFYEASQPSTGIAERMAEESQAVMHNGRKTDRPTFSAYELIFA